MKLAFISQGDFANSGYWIAKSLETQGHEIISYCRSLSVFEYPEHFDGWSKEIWNTVATADMVVIVQEMPRGRRFQVAEDLLRGKRVVSIFGGSHYRQKPERYNYQPECTILYSADLMGLIPGQKEILCPPPLDLKYFPMPMYRKTCRFGHFPARAWQKGSREILPLLRDKWADVVTSVNDDFEGENKVPWLEQLNRMQGCDIIIDQIYPDENGKKVGEWVAIATEAAALGCVSIANSHQPEVYKKAFGRYPEIHICNTIDELGAEVDRLMSLNPTQLWAERMASREWVEQYHSLEACGKYLCEHVFH